MPTSPRVLVVQNREALAEATRWRLATAGYEPVVAPDGDAAERCVELVAPHAIVVDLSLAVFDGWYVLARFGAAAEPRVIAYCPRKSDEERALALGAAVCVPDVGEIVAALHAVVGAPTAF